MKLAAIRGKSNEQLSVPVASNDRSSDELYEDVADSEPVGSAVDDSDELTESANEAEPDKINSKELIEFAMKWGAEISDNGFLINNTVGMSKKDYMKYIKGLSQEALLEDPLLHVLFRSEEQGDANFFHWVDRFPKAI